MAMRSERAWPERADVSLSSCKSRTASSALFWEILGAVAGTVVLVLAGTLVVGGVQSKKAVETSLGQGLHQGVADCVQVGHLGGFQLGKQAAANAVQVTWRGGRYCVASGRGEDGAASCECSGSMAARSGPDPASVHRVVRFHESLPFSRFSKSVRSYTGSPWR